MGRWNVRAIAGLAVAMLAVVAGPAAARAAPVPADPAQDAGFPLTASLASAESHRTVSEGSTAGFTADDDVFSPSEIAPGATGWWLLSGKRRSVYEIESCGSGFAAELTAYKQPSRVEPYPYRFTTDACTEPLVGVFDGTGTQRLRIDDATGSGGNYIVRYSRSAPIRARIDRVRAGRLRRNGTARVNVRVSVRSDIPVAIKCKLDGGRANGGKTANCRRGTTFRKVSAAGRKHHIELVVKAGSLYVTGDSARVRVPMPAD